MGLFSFFKKSDKVGQENTIDSKVLLGNTTKNTGDNRDVETKLSFHPEWDVPQEQKYIFNFLANELEPLKPNQLSLSSISIEEGRGGKLHLKNSILKRLVQFQQKALDHGYSNLKNLQLK